MPWHRHAQPRFLSILLGAWLFIFFLTRLVLLATHYGEAAAGPLTLAGIFGLGLLSDLRFLVYAALPWVLYVALCPAAVWRHRLHRGLLQALVSLSLFVMLFVAVAEWLFWNEFGVRFNFIAVDYLVYSAEVIDNILQSYPIYPLLALLLALSLVTTRLLRGTIFSALDAPLLPRKSAWSGLVVMACAAVVVSIAPNPSFPGANSVRRELASNGPFQFFAAFRNNELDYASFYATLPGKETAALLRQEVADPGCRFLDADPLDLRRRIAAAGPFRQCNVVLVTVESLSAKFLGVYGDSRGLTPNLDRLCTQSLLFRNFYATGTRTTRGLEAITLSVPPTPGRSIVKRIGRESGYSSLGRQLGVRGYDCVFLYGGRGYFDNMNAFFQGNGYRVVDQTSVPGSAVTFKNAWGMCDEDLYAQALRVADEDAAAGRPFCLQLMTTSNHRPYTYPGGRIDIPSGSGREGAVKYTDYAIGKFLDQARSRAWFDNTLFVFVADHTAGSAGIEDLPVENYRIPLIVHAPGFLAAGEADMLASQIDLAPTLLGIMNLSYVSTFFGRDLLHDTTAPGRALLGNYQHLGLFDGRDLAILSPKGGMRRHKDALGQSTEVEVSRDDALIRRCIAYYQGASHDFQHGLLLWRSEDQHYEVAQ